MRGRGKAEDYIGWKVPGMPLHELGGEGEYPPIQRTAYDCSRKEERLTIALLMEGIPLHYNRTFVGRI